jgi:hypothetical protein
MFDVILELTYVSSSIRIDLFAMFVANTIIEMPDQLRTFVSEIAPVTRD